MSIADRRAGADDDALEVGGRLRALLGHEGQVDDGVFAVRVDQGQVEVGVFLGGPVGEVPVVRAGAGARRAGGRPRRPVTTCWTAAPPPSNSTVAPMKAALPAAVSGTTRRSRAADRDRHAGRRPAEPTPLEPSGGRRGVDASPRTWTPRSCRPATTRDPVSLVTKVTVPCSARPMELAMMIWPSATLAGWPSAPPQNHVEEMALGRGGGGHGPDHRPARPGLGRAAAVDQPADDQQADDGDHHGQTGHPRPWRRLGPAGRPRLRGHGSTSLIATTRRGRRAGPSLTRLGRRRGPGRPWNPPPASPGAGPTTSLAGWSSHSKATVGRPVRRPSRPVPAPSDEGGGGRHDPHQHLDDDGEGPGHGGPEAQDRGSSRGRTEGHGPAEGGAPGCRLGRPPPAASAGWRWPTPGSPDRPGPDP